MYDNQYLRDNFPDAQGQSMARAILTQPEFRDQIQPGIFVAANTALGFTPGTLSPSDPNYYQKMAMVGSASANPYFMQTAYVSGVDQAHAQALVQANAQIAQSQGYKTPVNCAGSLAQQQQIDLKAKAASDQLANRQALYNSLLTAGPAANQSDLAKAKSDLDNATIAWNNVPFTVTGTSSVSSLQQGGGNNTEGTMAIAMCEAISSPATLINQGIDSVVSHYTDGLSQYNNNNLPAFISIIGQVASQIGSSLIFGGAGAAQGAAIINESTVANSLTASVSQTITANAASSSLNSITFIAVPSSGTNVGVGKNYQLNWDASAVSGSDHVTILGDGIQSTLAAYPVSGSTTVATSKGGVYTLSVYDSNNNLLATRSITINVNSAQTSFSYNNSGSPTVAGAFTSIPVLQTRGPAVTIAPRGE